MSPQPPALPSRVSLAILAGLLALGIAERVEAQGVPSTASGPAAEAANGASAVAAPEIQRGTAPSRPLPRANLNELQRGLFDLYETPPDAAAEPFEWTLTKRAEKPDYVVWDITFPSALPGDVEANRTVHGRYWTPAGELQDQPSAVVLHWLGGGFEVLDVICAGLARNGVCALMVFMPHYGPRRVGSNRMITDDPERLTRNFRQAVLDIRRGGDWLAARPEIDAERIGLVGISLGSVVGALVAGVDTQFSRSVLLIGGGDLPAIVMNPSRETSRLRRKVAELGLDVDDLREMWRPLEPLTWASRIDPASVYMVNATEDEIIPQECAVALQEAIGLEEIEYYEGGHYAIVLPILELIENSAAHLRGDERP